MIDYIAPVVAGMFIGMVVLLFAQYLLSRNSTLDGREDTERIDFLEERGMSLQYVDNVMKWGCLDANGHFVGLTNDTARGAIDSVMYKRLMEDGPPPMENPL